MNSFTITAINPDTETGTEIVTLRGDTLFTRPFGLVILNIKEGREYFFAKHVWQKVEMGDYKKASKNANIAMNVSVDTTKYSVSAAEFDNEGNLSLSIFDEKGTVRENKWILVFAYGSYDFVQRVKR